MTTDPSGVAILFVNYHSEAMISPRAEAFRSAGFEVVVVDNSGTYDAKANVRVVRPEGNLGFAGGCNAGRHKVPASCRFICYHNPDVDVEPRDVMTLVTELSQHESPGAIAPMVTTAAGLRPEGHHFPEPLREVFIGPRALLLPRKRWRSRQVAGRASGPGVARFAEGSLLVVDVEALDLIGGWDDRYFLYGEDLDLWHRLQEHGRSVLFSRTVHIRHTGAEGSRMSTADREVMRWLGVELFAQLHEGPRWRLHRRVHRVLLPLAMRRRASVAPLVAALWRSGCPPVEVQRELRQYLQPENRPLHDYRVHLVHRSSRPLVGGIESQYERIATHLMRRGAEVHLWTATPGAVGPLGTQVHTVPQALAGFGAALYGLWVFGRLVVRSGAGRRDVVIAGRASVESTVGCLVSALRGWRSVVYLAGGSERGPEFATQRRRWVKELIGRFAAEVVGHTSDAFAGIADCVPRRLVPVLVENEPKDCTFTPSWEPDQLHTVWCARNHPVKDPGHLCRMAETRFRQSGIQTLVITDDGAGFGGSLIQVHLDCPEPRSHFSEADVAILTSLYEAQPNVLAEAALEGCPFVAFDVGGLRESITALDAGDVIDPGDDGAFVAAVIQVAERFATDRSRAALAERAHERHVEIPKVEWERVVVGDVRCR